MSHHRTPASKTPCSPAASCSAARARASARWPWAALLAEAGLLGSPARAADQAGASRRRRSHRSTRCCPSRRRFPARAKRVIHLFMNGGPSHVDTFDPKPLLDKYARQAAAAPNLPHRAQDRRRVPLAVQVPEVRPERHRGQRALRPHRRACIDDICVIRSMHADVPNHEPSLLLMNCGDARLTRPSLGSWVTYGLGTENQNLPGFVVMCPGGYPIAGDAELAGRRSCPASTRARTSTPSTPTSRS